MPEKKKKTDSLVSAKTCNFQEFLYKTHLQHRRGFPAFNSNQFRLFKQLIKQFLLVQLGNQFGLKSFLHVENQKCQNCFWNRILKFVLDNVEVRGNQGLNCHYIFLLFFVNFWIFAFWFWSGLHSVNTFLSSWNIFCDPI